MAHFLALAFFLSLSLFVSLSLSSFSSLFLSTYLYMHMNIYIYISVSISISAYIYIYMYVSVWQTEILKWTPLRIRWQNIRGVARSTSQATPFLTWHSLLLSCRLDRPSGISDFFLPFLSISFYRAMFLTSTSGSRTCLLCDAQDFGMYCATWE